MAHTEHIAIGVLIGLVIGLVYGCATAPVVYLPSPTPAWVADYGAVRAVCWRSQLTDTNGQWTMFVKWDDGSPGGDGRFIDANSLPEIMEEARRIVESESKTKRDSNGK